MVEHRLPGWEVARQVPPRTASAQDVEDRIKNGTQRVGSWSATFGQGRQMLLQGFPLGVGEVAWIDSTHASQYIKFWHLCAFPKHALTKCKVAVRLADREEKGDVVRTRKREEKEQHRHASDHEQVRLSVRLDRCAMGAIGPLDPSTILGRRSHGAFNVPYILYWTP